MSALVIYYSCTDRYKVMGEMYVPKAVYFTIRASVPFIFCLNHVLLTYSFINIFR
jgi:hypothetical protein